MSAWNTRALLTVLLLLGLLLLGLWTGLSCDEEELTPSPTAGAGEGLDERLDEDPGEDPGEYPRLAVELLRVVDGDTILVRLPNGATERVRYIGIDSPESVSPNQPVEAYGPEAAQRNRELLEERELELEFDVQEHDRYGRLLAYVFADGIFINRRLVAEGLAWAVSYPPNVRRQQQLLEAERAARREGVGIWSGDLGKSLPLESVS